ncbi:MAG TPA: hypothetical protein VMO20_02730 [Candidatus Acidoferrum sp.]|nr:hypothetical protein [Candidatus Acidoferrum sp.]
MTGVSTNYDDTFVNTVHTNWHTLLYSKAYWWFWSPPTEGQVLLKFRLHSDGRITDMTVAKRNVPLWQVNICKKAVMMGEPYEPWTAAMLKNQKTNCDEVNFTFDYSSR